MVHRDTLTESKHIQRRTGRNFHVATRLLPERARHATYVLYAFFRIADDVVDDPDPDAPTEQRARLDEIRQGALGGDTDDPVLAAFSAFRERHGIPELEVHAFLDAMERDIDATPYATRDDLDAYLRGSAVAVANMMLAVMTPDDPEAARPHAKALGEAFQLTNFLRDVRQDVIEYDRVYLPEATLHRHGVTIDEVRHLEFSDRFAAAMRDELERTEALYREGVDGITYLPPDTQFGVLLAAVLYADHHRLIREQGYDVLTTRPTLTTARRLELAARTWWRFRRNRDPRAVFDALVDHEPTPDTVAGDTSGSPLPSVDGVIGYGSRLVRGVTK